MAFRGGRRGKGRGKRGYGFDKPEPFVIFPETTLPDPKPISNDSKLLSSYFGFQKFWRNSPYHLGDGVLKQESESLDIERFSDALKPKKKSNKSGSSFYDFLLLRPDNFPKELLGGTRRDRPVKRAKWTQEIDLKDVFQKLEDKYKPEENEEEEEDKGENEEGEDKKENEEGEDKEENEEGEDGEEVEESDGEELDNGDYDQNQDFDDDDDDYNQAADGDYEDVY